ncbi:hypothetical protein [Micromonospora sp. HM5-17]|uniref:hypothetical protein n=1 Tax=Micromonospora sp. HM5-17 TaxID=2487710 RepID=UPI000F46D674|nr:hypothetical protein [Micromonospora sp. HM5-17]ROT32132.1 hypothetical protein EF879_11005 [Micromonospora sp. HM5-17]
MPDRYGHDDDLRLPDLDVLGDSDKLQAELRRELANVGDHYVPPPRHEGADGSDSIWVTIDAEGHIESVDISRHWRDRLGSERFPAALHEAYTDAVRKLINANALAALVAQEQVGGQPVAPRDPTDVRSDQTDAAPEPPVDDQEWLNQTWRLLEDIDTQLRRLHHISADVHLREQTVTSPQGYLRARVRGGGITDITGDIQYIRSANPEQLRMEALGLFRTVAKVVEN